MTQETLCLIAVILLGAGSLGCGASPAQQALEQGAGNYDQGKWDQAIADFTKALELDPEFDFAYLNRGYASKAKGENSKAAADFETYIHLNPGASDRAKVEQLIKELE